MSKVFRSMVIAGITLALPLSSAAVASASPESATKTLEAPAPRQLSSEDRAFLKHVGNASKTFVDRDGKIATTASDQTLASKYGFTSHDISRLHSSVLGKSSRLSKARQQTTYATREGSSVCFSHDDLLVGAGAAIVAASDAGPVAIAAALEAAASVFGGPVGAGIGLVLGAASAPSLIEIGGRAATAAATNRGLKIGVHLDYPPVYADYC